MIRSLIVLTAAIAILCGGLVAYGATALARAEWVRGTVDPLSDANLPYRVPILGVNADLTQYDDAALADQLAAMRAAGITWVRQEVRWSAIAPQPNETDYRPYDRIVSAAHAAGLEVIAVLGTAPEWARDERAADRPTAPPSDSEAFAAFAGDVAARYAGLIDYYQIWDEPNIAIGWGGLDPQPTTYLAMLAAAYGSIHAADPDATVMLAGLAPTVETAGQNLSDWQYLDALYQAGAADYFDAAAGKPYGFAASPADRVVSPQVLSFSRLIGLREIMLSHDDGHTPLWASHFGWNSLPADWSGSPSIWGSVTAEAQVIYTLDALNRAESEWAWTGGMILHQWQPVAPCDDPQWGFALIDCQGTAKPLYTALVERAAARPTAALTGLHPAASPFAAYSGVWSFGPLGADIGWVQDSRARLTFSGDGAALLLRKDAYTAFLYVTVDGEPANALPIDAFGRAYIPLSSADAQPDLTLIPIAHGLAPGLHTLEFEADRGWDRWAIAGYAVASSFSTADHDRLLLLSAVTAVIGALLTLVTLPQVIHRIRASVRIVQLAPLAHLALSGAAALGVMLGMLLTFGAGQAHLFRREPVNLVAALLTAGLIYVQPGVVLTLISLAVLFYLLYHRPASGVLLTLFFAPFFLFPVELFQYAFPMSELLIIVTVGAALLHGYTVWATRWQQGDRPGLNEVIHLHALDIAALLWLILGTAALLWSEQFRRAVTEWRVLFIEPIAFYALMRVYGRDRALVIRAVETLLAAAALVCAIGLVQYAGGQAIITAEDGARRLASVYGSPNNVALLLGRALPFALAAALVLKGLRRWIAAGLVALFAVTLVLTQSAGALFIGLPAAIVVVLLLSYRWRALLPIIGLGAIGVIGTALAAQSSRFARLLDFSQGTNFFRLRVWQSAIDMIAERPFTGIGLDQFLYLYRGSFIRPDAWQEPNLSHPHNLVLDTWLRLGLLGLAVLVWMQIAFWRGGLNLWRSLQARDRLLWAICIGALGSMTGLIGHGLVDNSIFVMDLAIVFFFLNAIISNMRAIDDKA